MSFERSAPAVLIPGDCLTEMRAMAERGERFDAVVTDPPYHLTSVVERFGKPDSAPAIGNGETGVYARVSRGFMGKEWDGGDVAFRPETWRLVYDLLKPGAHLVAFSGTRTYHRMACAIEDAGFEIRDQLAWMYGTGFPKSLNVDKHLADENRCLCHRNDATYRNAKKERSPDDQNMQRVHEGLDSCDAVSGSQVSGAWPHCERCGKPRVLSGLGTALKPGWEPIVLARKPLIGTVASNVLAHGTGALNIDACRIEAGWRPLIEKRIGQPATAGHKVFGSGLSAARRGAGLTDEGRWPANVMHDGSDEVEAAFAAFGAREGGGGHVKKRGASVPCMGAANDTTHIGVRNSGTASRFFYSAKASKADRAGSKHPTVKPLALMRWLCTMVTPPGGTILDPFAGSGATLQAAAEAGFRAVGIEREPEYCADILARLARMMVDTPAASFDQLDMFGGAP